MDAVLEIRDLVKRYPVLGGVLRRPVNMIRALDGLTLDIRRGECLGLVGESGCGKTTAAKTMLRLQDPTSGEVVFRPKAGGTFDLTAMSPREMTRSGVRQGLQMVFQDPAASMNPRMLVKNIVTEPIRARESLSSRDVGARAAGLLGLVGLSGDHLLRYPHEFSGGQRQRIAVARALASEPEFLALDEPTSALDVSVQAQILNLLHRLRREMGLTYLFVTHHLLAVKYVATRIAVMYLGKLVELAETDALFARPLHPYTHALLSGVPVPDPDAKRRRIVLEGDVPSPTDPPAGCRFHPRCPFCVERCRMEEPLLRDVGADRTAACHRVEEMDALAGLDC